MKIVVPLRNPAVFFVGLFVLVLGNQLLRSATAGEVSKIWYELYLELNPEHDQVVKDALWLQSVSDWAKREQDRLEPIVIDILEGNRPNTPWTRALSVTRAIPTKRIRDILLRRIDDAWEEHSQEESVLDKMEHRRIAFIMVTMADAGDGRCSPILHEILRAGVPAGSIKSYLKALQKVGDENSIKIIRGLDMKRFDGAVARLASLTTSIIEARIEERVFPTATTPNELRAVSQQFLKACNAADLRAYTACLPWNYGKLFDEDDMHEFLHGEHGKSALAAIRSALDANTPFEIDRENLQAKLVCDDRFLLEYIYEVDGWKIMNLRPLTEAQANHKPGSSGKP